MSRIKTIENLFAEFEIKMRNIEKQCEELRAYYFGDFNNKTTQDLLSELIKDEVSIMKQDAGNKKEED